MDEPVHGFIAGDEGAEENDEDDGDAREILDPAKTVGEGRGGLPSGQHKGDPERDRRRGIGEIMNRIGEERDAARDRNHDDLQGGRDRKDDERPLDRPNAPFRRRNRRVYDAMGMAVTSAVTVIVTAVCYAKAEPVEHLLAHVRPHKYFESCLSSRKAVLELTPGSSKQCSR